MLYDCFAVLAIMMGLTILAVGLRGGQPIASGTISFQLLLLFSNWLYFAYCWRFGGQTLGMRAWGVHLTGSTAKISWTGTLVRYVTAWLSAVVIGAGFWTAIWHPARLTWHDLLSNTWLEHRTG